MPDDSPAERITGIGGVFFRAKDPTALGAWYAKHLGVPVTEGGHAIIPESRNTAWSPFTADTDYWPREKEHMVNYTVRDLDTMLAQLRAAASTSTTRSRITSTAGSGGSPIPRATASSSGSRSTRTSRLGVLQ